MEKIHWLYSYSIYIDINDGGKKHVFCVCVGIICSAITIDAVYAAHGSYPRCRYCELIRSTLPNLLEAMRLERERIASYSFSARCKNADLCFQHCYAGENPPTPADSRGPRQRRGDKRWNKKLESQKEKQEARSRQMSKTWKKKAICKRKKKNKKQDARQRSRWMAKTWKKNTSSKKKTSKETHQHFGGLRPAASKLELISCWFRNRRDILAVTGKKARSGLHWHALSVWRDQLLEAWNLQFRASFLSVQKAALGTTSHRPKTPAFWRGRRHGAAAILWSGEARRLIRTPQKILHSDGVLTFFGGQKKTTKN